MSKLSISFSGPSTGVHWRSLGVIASHSWPGSHTGKAEERGDCLVGFKAIYSDGISNARIFVEEVGVGRNLSIVVRGKLLEIVQPSDPKCNQS